MGHRVVGQLGDDLCGGFGGNPPGPQVRGREKPGEAGRAVGGGEQNGELSRRSGMFGSGDFFGHVTQSGRFALTVNSESGPTYGHCPGLVQRCPGCPG
jgi:hypothetical protein